MTDVDVKLVSQESLGFPRIFKILRSIVPRIDRRTALDIHSMPDHLRQDIGLLPECLSGDRDINMTNVALRSGIMFPRPC